MPSPAPKTGPQRSWALDRQVAAAFKGTRNRDFHVYVSDSFCLFVFCGSNTNGEIITSVSLPLESIRVYKSA